MHQGAMRLPPALCGSVQLWFSSPHGCGGGTRRRVPAAPLPPRFPPINHTWWLTPSLGAAVWRAANASSPETVMPYISQRPGLQENCEQAPLTFTTETENHSILRMSFLRLETLACLHFPNGDSTRCWIQQGGSASKGSYPGESSGSSPLATAHTGLGLNALTRMHISNSCLLSPDFQVATSSKMQARMIPGAFSGEKKNKNNLKVIEMQRLHDVSLHYYSLPAYTIPLIPLCFRIKQRNRATKNMYNVGWKASRKQSNWNHWEFQSIIYKNNLPSLHSSGRSVSMTLTQFHTDALTPKSSLVQKLNWEDAGVLLTSFCTSLCFPRKVKSRQRAAFPLKYSKIAGG